MDKVSVDTPGLSGVRTFAKDVAEEHNGVKFDAAQLAKQHMPTNMQTEEHATPASGSGKPTFDVERAYNDAAVQIGTIVTDKKKGHASFGQLLKSALSEWWTITQKSVQSSSAHVDFLKPKVVPKIEVAETRSTVIQEAAKYARQAPRDDHAMVIEKIRTFAHDAERATGKPFSFKSSSSHTQNPTIKEAAGKGVPLVETRTKNNPVLQQKSVPTLSEKQLPEEPLHTKQTSLATYALPTTSHTDNREPTPAFTVSPMAKKTALSHTDSVKKKTGGWSHFIEAHDKKEGSTSPSSHPVREPSRTTVVETLSRSIAPTVPFEEIANVTANVGVPQRQERPPQRPMPALAPILPPVQQVIPTPVVPAIPVSTVKPVTPPKPVSQSRQEPSHILRNTVWSSFAVVGAGLGIFAALMITQKISEPQTTEVVPVVVPSFLNTDTEVSIPLPRTRTELWSTLHTEIQKTTDPITYIYPVITTEVGTAPANTQEIMEVLSFNTDGSFIRSLKEHSMFGAVATVRQEPYIIFQTSNFDVAFAGMLKWERNMSSDLSPFFGSPVLRTFPPTGSTASTNPHFLDALTSDHTTRILYDETGRERIVYAFVNKNLIIITTSTEALTTLIEQIE